MTAPRILITAGGTGGHLLPAQQLGHLLTDKKQGAQILFAAKGLAQNPLLDRETFSFAEIPSAAPSLKTLFSFLKAIFLGSIESWKLFSRFRPHVVVGFGSYHTFPVLLVARLRRIPIALFSADCTLGRVNRFFAKKADVVAFQFPIKEGHSSLRLVSVPLLPWHGRRDRWTLAEGRKYFGLQEFLFTFLVFGGSQGANFINTTWEKVAANLQAQGRAFQVIHLTGSEEAKERAIALYHRLAVPHYVQAYEKKMDAALSAASVAFCRAGASTLGELIYFEVPSLVIPYPFSSENHQEMNADFMEGIVQGGIKGLQNEPLERLEEKIKTLMHEEEIQRKRTLIRAFKEREAKEGKRDLAEVILQICNQQF